MRSILRLSLCVLLAFASGASAREPRWKIVDHGVYELPPSGSRVTAAGSSSGDVAVVDALVEPKLVAKTSTIDARLGVHFGFQFLDESLRSFDARTITVRVEHPPIVGTDGRATTIDTWPQDAQGIPRLTGWAFEREEELVAGRWTISIEDAGKTVLSRAFDVQVDARR